jgi:hypothetical protein
MKLNYGIAILFILFLCASCDWRYDSIAEANIKTQSRLEEYEKTKNADQFYDWLFSRHGSAPGHQVFITLARWSFDNANRFEELLASLPKDKQENFIISYSFAVTDSGNGEIWIKIFGDYDRSIFPEIKTRIEKNLQILKSYKQE